ncbi:hypothetical protein PO124_27530 [Bacillus licheniformis]|nr:hypothetical protein [Bacillus licheniformis]
MIKEFPSCTTFLLSCKSLTAKKSFIIFKISGSRDHKQQEFKRAVELVSKEYGLQLVEERLNEFIYFLMMYSIRVAEGKLSVSPGGG